MAEWTCPVCGRSNPEGSETCQNCGANLYFQESGHEDESLTPASGSLPVQVENTILPGIEGSLLAVPAALVDPAVSVQPYHLKTSETQKNYVTLLEQMTQPAQERSPVASASAVRKPRYFLLGWGIVLVALLMIAITWPGIRLGLPSVSSEALAVNRHISKISSGAVVLVAVDYQPAFTAEMEMASQAVLDQLVAQEVNLVFVSTVPSGYWQAERLIQKIGTDRSRRGAPATLVYQNLGFIPGGALGLANFAGQPSQFIDPQLQAASDGPALSAENGPALSAENGPALSAENGPALSAENGPALSAANGPAMVPGVIPGSIRSINDFEAVFVLTEDPDTARDWLEQVQPFLASTPLLMIVSAQAEPMIRPYLEMQPAKIQGILVGVQGGAEYESLSNQVQSARANWTASMLGNILGGLVLAGGLAVFFAYHQWNERATSAGQGKRQ